MNVDQGGGTRSHLFLRFCPLRATESLSTIHPTLPPSFLQFRCLFMETFVVIQGSSYTSIYVHIRPFTSIELTSRLMSIAIAIYVILRPFTSIYVNAEAVSNPILVTFVMTGKGGSRGGFPWHDGQNQSKTHNPEIDDLLVKKCLTSIFELSVHEIGTILKSEALTFQSASI